MQSTLVRNLTVSSQTTLFPHNYAKLLDVQEPTRQAHTHTHTSLSLMTRFCPRFPTDPEWKIYEV